MSFVTALNTEDGNSGDYSYINLVSFVKSYCDNVNDNLLELFKRLVFTYLINNTDNHLRNHGIIFKDKKMILSPSFDMNPTFFISDFALPLVKDKELSKDSIIVDSKYYGLTPENATEIYNFIAKTVNDNLESLANKYNARKNELDILKKIIIERQ